MNRRIPIGTYGGVGGRRLDASSYPIARHAHLFKEVKVFPWAAITGTTTLGKGVHREVKSEGS